MGQKRNSYSVWWENLKKKNQLGRSTLRNEDDIKVGTKETEWKGVGWIIPAQNMYKLRIR